MNTTEPDKARAAALKAYGEATAPAFKAYKEALTAALKAYGEATAPARKAYKEGTVSRARTRTLHRLLGGAAPPGDKALKRDDDLCDTILATTDALEALGLVRKERLEAAIASYEAKVADLGRETLRTSAVHQFCRENNNRPGRGPVGEAGLGWNDALTAVQQLLNEAGAALCGPTGAGGSSSPPAPVRMQSTRRRQ